MKEASTEEMARKATTHNLRSPELLLVFKDIVDIPHGCEE
jgi:hypothetical protein